jgi:hypothetical protein
MLYTFTLIIGIHIYAQHIHLLADQECNETVTAGVASSRRYSTLWRPACSSLHHHFP